MIQHSLTVAALLFVSIASQVSCSFVPKHDLYPYHHHFNPYSYGFDVEDDYGNKQWRQERSHNPQEVHGSYGYRDNNGIYREVVYVADKDGFRANIKTNEPGIAGSKSPSAVKLETSHPASSHERIHNKNLATTPIAIYSAAPHYYQPRPHPEVSHHPNMVAAASAPATTHRGIGPGSSARSQVPVYTSPLIHLVQGSK